MRSIRLVLHVRMLAYAWGTPCVHIETLSTDEPVLADFLWAARNESELLAITSGTVIFHSTIFQKRLLMGLEKMATKAP